MNNIQNKADKKEELFYKGLSNDELVIVFYKFKNYFNNLNNHLDKNMIVQNVQTPVGLGQIVKEVSEKHVELFRESRYYNTLSNIVEKLEPVVKLIEDCDPDMKDLSQHFKQKTDE
jgi:hypothetical protein